MRDRNMLLLHVTSFTHIVSTPFYPSNRFLGVISQDTTKNSERFLFSVFLCFIREGLVGTSYKTVSSGGFPSACSSGGSKSSDSCCSLR